MDSTATQLISYKCYHFGKSCEPVPSSLSLTARIFELLELKVYVQKIAEKFNFILML